jgi:hypothetical protein
MDFGLPKVLIDNSSVEGFGKKQIGFDQKNRKNY